jgi:DNA topoisomerase-2
LNYLEEDGQSIEPEFYIPVIPMILVNGGVGIGTGFSTNIPQFNPEDIISICMKVCNGIADKDVTESQSFINKMKIEEFVPWYLGHTGKILKSDKGSYVSTGVYSWIDDNTLEITELPIGTWTEDYKEYLENMITSGSNYLKSFDNHYTSKNVKFVLNFNGDVRGKLGNKFESEFKLVSSKNMSINNMHLYSNVGAIKKYDNTSDIIREWCKVRIQMYDKRKKYQIKILEKDFKVLSAKIRFIIDVIEGRIVVMNKKIAEIIAKLVELKYPKISKDDDTNDDTKDGANEQVSDDNGYNYLLRMPISQLTYDRKIILEKEVDELSKKLNDLRNTSLDKIWKNELQDLLNAWKAHREYIETDYENDKNGIVTPKSKKRLVKAKK